MVNIANYGSDESVILNLVTVAILGLVGALAIAFLLDKRVPKTKKPKKAAGAKKKRK